ncbi:MAG: hypothetical protein VYA32_02640 [Planctomycetota bacterium]|nr:hypothetical protein [Planctomycetota bacterium]MED5399554.1 hypothetical protein [Planctomycetota bacterium]
MPIPVENESDPSTDVSPPTVRPSNANSPVRTVLNSTRRRLGFLVVTLLATGLLMFFVFVRPRLDRQNISNRINKTARVFRGLKGDTWSLAFTPDGQHIASPSGNSVELRAVTSGRLIRSLDGHTKSVMRIAISPDGQQLASTSMDQTIRLWDIGTGETLQTLEGHTNSVLAVAFSPDGKLLASASRDHSAKLWELATGKVLHSYESTSGFVVDVAFSPDGKHIATAASFRPFKMGDKTVILKEPGEINLWEIQTGTSILSLKGHDSAIVGVDFSPDGKHLVSISRDKTAKLWNVATGKQVHTFTGHEDFVVGVAFSPNGRQLATSSDDGTVRLWNTHTGGELLSISAHQNGTFCVRFSPNGHQLAAGGFSMVTLWDLESLNLPSR